MYIWKYCIKFINSYNLGVVISHFGLLFLNQSSCVHEIKKETFPALLELWCFKWVSLLKNNLILKYNNSGPPQ